MTRHKTETNVFEKKGQQTKNLNLEIIFCRWMQGYLSPGDRKELNLEHIVLKASLEVPVWTLNLDFDS